MKLSNAEQCNILGMHFAEVYNNPEVTFNELNNWIAKKIPNITIINIEKSQGYSYVWDGRPYITTRWIINTKESSTYLVEINDIPKSNLFIDVTLVKTPHQALQMLMKHYKKLEKMHKQNTRMLQTFKF